jgi:uncharacterized membrane protein (UPF0136 family)
MFFTGLALLVTGILVTQMHLRKLVVVAITVLLALLTWAWTRRKAMLPHEA